MGRDPDLLRHLLQSCRRDGGSWEFFELIRNFDRVNADLPRTGCAGSVAGEGLRLAQTPSLRPNLPDIDVIENAPHEGILARVRTFVLGLCGTNGPMPLEFTSDVYQRTYNYYDPALLCFLDIINHRFLALYYRAFAFHQTAVSADRPDDDLQRLIMRALSGSGYDHSISLPAGGAEAMAPHTMSKLGSAEGLGIVLENYFKVRMVIRSTIFSHYRMPENLYCRLGCGGNNVLGQSTQIGELYFSCSHKFRICVGPIKFSECLKLLPGTADFAHLNEIICFYLTRPRHYELEFAIFIDSMPDPVLDGSLTLGQNSFLPFRRREGLCTLNIDASRIWRRRNPHRAGSPEPGRQTGTVTA